MKQTWLIVMVVLLIVLGVVKSQTDTPPEPSIRSIFDYDTCAPPCWMGLIPGESTVRDVDNMLEQNQELIPQENISFSIPRLPSGEFAVDPETGDALRATYNFDIGEPYVDSMGVTSRIEIQDGLVHALVIFAHERITLSEVLESFGEPEIVRLSIFRTILPRIRVIYTDTRLRVNLHMDNIDCNVTTLLDEMVVSSVLYFSPDAAIELERYEPNDIVQPALTYHHLEARDVSSNLWQSWLEGEVDMSCEEAWELLPEPEITPAVEATVEPKSTEESG